MKKRIPKNLLKSIGQHLNSAGETIVQEGCLLYEGGSILTLEFFDDNYFEAAAEDEGNLYNVSVTLDKSHKIYHLDCECAHESGRSCRHRAAVLLAIRDGRYNEHTPLIPSDFRDVILRADETRLRQFAADYMEQNTTFRNHLLAVLGILPEEQIFDEIRQLLNKAVYDYRNTSYRYSEPKGQALRITLKTTLDDTEEYFKNGYSVLTFKASIYILRSAAEVVYSMYKGQNDVLGWINRALELCEESLDRIMESGSEEDQQTICRYGLLQAGYCKKWCEPLLQILFPLADRWMPVQLDKKVEHLADRKNVSLDFRLNYLLTLRGEEAYEEYLTGHIANDTIRRTLINMFLERGNYEKAKALCLERLKGEQFPHNRRDWLELLFGIYEKEHNVSRMIETAKQLLYLDEEDYYDILKNLLVQSGEWENVYFELMDELSKKLSVSRYYGILLKEKEYRLLLDRIETGDGYSIFEYGYRIAEEYPDEVSIVYRAKLEEMAECAGKREEYQEICRHLKELADIGGTSIVYGMIENFRVRYKRRAAFIEELRNVEKSLGGL